MFLFKNKKSIAFLSAFVFAFMFAVTFVNTKAVSAAIPDWQAGNIISDSVFTNKSSMSVNSIQSFLNSKVPNCDTWGEETSEYGGGTRRQWAESRGYSPPFTCLRDYLQNGKSSAQIIYDAAQEFSINPQVLIVLLQKEQGLVTDEWPVDIQYRSATGYGCPDTAACDSDYYGFTNQVRWAARMYHAIMTDSPTWYTPYVLGNNHIGYNPNSSCGGSTVNIQNRATKSLYNYTPYQPNQAVLNANWGQTVSCGAYGNVNFYMYFRAWFGGTRGQIFTRLDSPRYMIINKDTKKINPVTRQTVGDTLLSGRQIRIIDKTFANGKWYLRSEYDTRQRNVQGFEVADLSDIPFEPLSQPRYMSLSNVARKYNPRTWKLAYNNFFNEGRVLKFSSKMYVNGRWFYRTEHDTNLNRLATFSASNVQEVPYENFSEPRYLRVTEDVQKVNPTTGEVDSSIITAGTRIKFTSKIYVGKWYYRTETDSNNNTKLAIDSSKVGELQYSDLSPDKWYQVKASTQKIDPSSGQMGISIPEGADIKFVEQITVEGILYYRTESDKINNRRWGIPITQLEEIPYINLDNPRQLKLKQDLQKVNPKTGEAVDSVIPKDTVANFTTKIYIGGKWYLRTEGDTTANADKAIPFSMLAEVD